MTRTLKDVLKRKAEQAERSNRPDFNWFTLAKNETKRVRFLQEFDSDMRNYDSSKGTALFLLEHVSPRDFTRRANCTIDTQGRCFACEMDVEEPSIGEGDKKQWHPWGQRENFYIQVVDEKGKVYVLSRSTSGKFFDALVDEAVEENDNSLTDITFKISKGDKNNSPWEVKSTKSEFDVEDVVELVDLEAAVSRNIDYVEQRNFYIPGGKVEKEDAPAKVETAKDVSEDW